MRLGSLVVAALLSLGGCSLSIDPDKVPEPPGPNCTPTCSGRVCGTSDGCMGTCQPGSGCTPQVTGHAVEGGITSGGLEVTGGNYHVRGQLDRGAAQSLQSNNYKVEQGTLR